jgi:hypothetical protein
VIPEVLQHLVGVWVLLERVQVGLETQIAVLVVEERIQDQAVLVDLGLFIFKSHLPIQQHSPVE